ncbi:hypothetical protein BLL52_1419 [Rhodoferax antarcticus ANT.BR]|uniref:Uncharacterized protein n=1 Tax=Rhodoferax antarcticus ANT.BR TaxID=1111071 RepID=A0A1Q8YI39_9BURK|nr:hypothetical protein BLL52_1419 [Rhodoferax antarcticus ANT.BR]
MVCGCLGKVGVRNAPIGAIVLLAHTVVASSPMQRSHHRPFWPT